MSTARLTLIGGPTALVEFGGFHFLTDPTFDGPGEYRLPHTTLTKTSRPACTPADIGAVDAVLLSHDQHADNLDRSGRDFLSRAPRVFTTLAGAKRLGGHAEGLAPWQTVTLTGPNGRSIDVTAAPARHGPAGIEPLAGDVIGFVLTISDRETRPIYITGDTSGTTASPRSHAVSRPASSFCSRAPRRRAVRFISRWTRTTPSKPRKPSRMRLLFPFTTRAGRISDKAERICKNPSMRSGLDHVCAY